MKRKLLDERSSVMDTYNVKIYHDHVWKLIAEAVTWDEANALRVYCLAKDIPVMVETWRPKAG